MTIAQGPHRQKSALEVHCLGNLDRGDDAVGLLVKPLLAERLAGEVRVRAHDGDPLALIDGWAGLEALICVDAAQPLGAPGRIHRINYYAQSRLLAEPVATTHHFGLADALSLAKVLNQLPATVLIFAVEGVCFDLGAELTPPVADAIPRLVAGVVVEASRLNKNLKGRTHQTCA
jgi:hydrogenase maturation protease